MGIINKNKQMFFWQMSYYISTAVLILMVFASIFFFNEEVVLEVIELSAKFGMIMLAIMFAIKNIALAHKKGDNIIADFLRQHLRMQREQGLIAFNAFVLHTLATIILYLVRLQMEIGLVLYMSFTAIVPSILMGYLYLTSFKPIQKRVKGWKKTHTLGWMLFGSVIAHELLLNGELETITIMATILAIGTLMYGFILNFNNKRSRKQFIMTVIGFGILAIMFLGNDLVGKEIKKIGAQVDYASIQVNAK